MPDVRKPSKAEIAAAIGKTVPDLIAPNLNVLFCGINPGLYSGATGYHFARPGNRFWPTLYAAGFTDRLLDPSEEEALLSYGYGITSLVERATATAAELSAEELAAGGRRLQALVEQYRPRAVAVLGITAYRAAFLRPQTALGQQMEGLGSALLWVLPNPSGLNAHYNRTELARVFREFREAVAAERTT